MTGRHVLYEVTATPGKPGYAKAVWDDMQRPAQPGDDAQLRAMTGNSLRHTWERLIDASDEEALAILRRGPRVPRHRIEEES